MSKPRKIDRELMAATCALLGSAAAQPAAGQDDPRWSLETALLYYGESDDRVNDASLTALATRDFYDERYLTLNLAIDTLTGATASGATALDVPQTFTSPSGLDMYTAPAGEIPLDPTFLDTRAAISASWSQPLGRLNRVSTGLSFSREYDYQHGGVNFSVSRDFDRRNTTLSAAVALSRDNWHPVGGAPIPLSALLGVVEESEDDHGGGQHDYGPDAPNKVAGDSKAITDVLLGITQVINPNLIVQFNYSYSDSSGYLNDPYKLLSVVDHHTGDTIAFVPPDGVPHHEDDDDEEVGHHDDFIGPDHLYRFESRPEERLRHSLFGRVKYWLGGDVLGLSYRFATDDWDIDSHTLDGRYRIALGDTRYVEPHLRYYTQTEANFYRFSLVDGEPLPEFAASDFRLGNFDAVTAGFEYGTQRDSGAEWSVRVEYYRQSGKVPAAQIIGHQAERDQFAPLDAVISQFTYKFDF